MSGRVGDVRGPQCLAEARTRMYRLIWEGDSRSLCFDFAASTNETAEIQTTQLTFPKILSYVLDVLFPHIQRKRRSFPSCHGEIIGSDSSTLSPDIPPSCPDHLTRPHSLVSSGIFSIALLFFVMGTNPGSLTEQTNLVCCLCCAVFYLFCILISIYYIFTNCFISIGECVRVAVTWEPLWYDFI